VTTHTSRNSTLASWLIGPSALLAIGAGLAIVRQGPGWIVAGVLGLALGGAVLWVIVSALAPATPDKTCPSCGEDRLRRMDPATTRGVACESCDWSDESLSSFYLAEEDGAPIEAIVIAERDKRAEHRNMSEAAR
jgi:hypothetical protein